MDLEKPKEDTPPAQPTPTPQAQSKKPSQALYVPKQRNQGSKDKTQTQDGVKPKPRPRYTDKARKNAKNKKNKASATDQAAAAGGEDKGEIKDGDNKPDGKEERLQDADVAANGHSESTSSGADVSSRLEAVSLQEEQGEEESWDTLFNDDGDCLDPHLMEEVRAGFKSGWCKKKRSIVQLSKVKYNSKSIILP